MEIKDDMISRAAAFEVIDAVKGVVWSQSGKVLCGKIHSQIKDIPAVDAVPVAQGEWVEEPDRTGHYHCSNCGVVWGIAAKAMKYCPNCAAKMMNSPIWDVEDAK